MKKRASLEKILAVIEEAWNETSSILVAMGYTEPKGGPVDFITEAEAKIRELAE